MSETERLIVLGKVLSPYALKGAFKVFSHCRPTAEIFCYSSWYLLDCSGVRQQYSVEYTKELGKFLVVKVVGIDTPEAAKLLNGMQIAVSEQQLLATAKRKKRKKRK